MYREEQLVGLLKDRKILIAGHGREGRSAETLLGRLLPQADVTIADGDEQISAAAKEGYDLIIKSPGVPMRLLGNAPHVSSLTDLFLQVYPDRVVAVSGTKGKSTTASLIHHLLPDSVLAGNIGVPLFDVIDRVDAKTLVVAELSCHQLEVLHRGPHVGVLLNLHEEHLDHYDSYWAYKMAKMQMGLRQSAADHLYYCADDAELQAMMTQCGGQIASHKHAYSLGQATEDEQEALDLLPLEGAHNQSNALVAIRVAMAVSGLPLAMLAPRLATFHGLRHRLERVGEKCGRVWYDDSISTIPAATINAVEALRRVDTLILGGFDRGIDYAPLVRFLDTRGAMNLVLVGQAGRRIKDGLAPREGQVLVEDDYVKIVEWCARTTPEGGTVLLSPAAASYDAFRNFEHRGDFFREQIYLLP